MCCVVEVWLRPKTKQGRVGLGISGIPGPGNRAMKIGDDVNNLILGGHGFNALQLSLQAGEGSRIPLFLIRTRGPVITDLLLNLRTLCGWLRCNLKHRLMQEALVPQLQLSEGVPENFIGRNRIVRDPAIARVLVKISAGIDRSVDLLRVEVIKLGPRGILRSCGLRESDA